ncbi:hypothetical protein [Ancylobacter rudongensis]|uniref:Uncharacterized protein n=1 Tax=Ancylobacter rudongensis TaxID=177413 RepID=A0A1G4UR59_9HYPH|nr:hypothetical protein [Ancylobacter rudongensis]SCW96136.1 hypothetical protein SAMN05660859_0168 [Ancylobacter rudongensis]
MKLNRNLTALALIGAGLSGWLLLREDDPARTARLKCEIHLEAATGHDLSAGEVASMGVTGDAHNGKVQGAFMRSDELRSAVCEFENGGTRRVVIDGKSWPHAAPAANAAEPPSASGEVKAL